MEHCEFIPLPLPDPSSTSDTRVFTAGEIVCIKGYVRTALKVTKGKYVKPSVINGLTRHHTIEVTMPTGEKMELSLPYMDIGKYAPVTGKIMAESVARQKKLPGNVGNILKKYVGGKTRKSKKSNKSKKSKKTRKH